MAIKFEISLVALFSNTYFVGKLTLSFTFNFEIYSIENYLLLYIPNRSWWKSFTIFMDRLVIAKLFQ